MKTTKQISIVTFIATMIVLTFISCKKYPDGPTLSLRSKAARISNTWKVDKYFKNGADETFEFKNKKINWTETFTKEGSWSYYYIDDKGDTKGDAGKWEFDKGSDKEKIDRNAGNSTYEELNILRLKENEFWFWYMDSGDRKEFHLIPN